MTETSERIRNLSPEKLELLLRQTRESAERAAAGDGVARRGDPGAPAPLSFVQQRLWFLDRLEPGTPLYNMHAAFRLRGELDVEALTESLGDVIRRHEILRTRFVLEGEEPVQRIDPERSPEIERVDLRPLPAAEQEAEWRRRARQDARHRFDLTADALVRFTLMRLGEQEWVLSVVLHHIVTDGWSIAILVRELGAAYASRKGAAAPPLDELPVQFADFAAWQRRRLQGEALAPDLDFWREHLGGAPALLELVSDRPRTATRSHEGAQEGFQLAAPATRALRELAARHDATLYMALVALYALLLSRYSGQETVLVGSPVAGRGQVETEGLIGPFVNTVVRRVDLGGDPTFAELLGRVRQAVLVAEAHDGLPFEKLVEELQPERSTSFTPLFQVWLVLHNTPRERLELPGVTFDPLDVHGGTSRFDLTLSVEENGDVLDAALEYRTDIFDAGTAAAMARQLDALAAAAASGADRPISELTMTAEGEAAELLGLGRAADPAPEADLGELLQRAAARDPRAPAVVCGAERLTYAELEKRGNQLANHLLAQALEPDTLVAICLPRSADLAVALVATLKAGGAALVLDPALPAERLEYLFEDTEAGVLLTCDELLYELPAHAAACDLVCLDSDWHEVEEHGDAQPAAAAGPNDRAYVIYTSGSTGRPKGVEVARGPLAAHLVAMREALGLGAGDRVLQFASLSFDVAYEQVLATLVSGATLVMRDREAWSPRELSERAVEHGLTVMNLPTGYWQQWVRAVADGTAEEPGGQLRLVMPGGDTLAPAAVREWLGSPLAGVRLVNAYGPTEAVVTATLHEVTAADGESARVPLGRPLPGRAVYLLDPHGRPVPRGVPGEIHLGGPLLARGYLGRPELTAEAFVRDPFAADPEARLYRTGDLARRRADGALEFLGRRDHQVKVRGYRIELGEVEEALRGYRKVKDAAVVVRGETAEDKELVGYVVPVRDDEPPTSAELREFLGDSLPEHAVPSLYTVLGELPRTASGKVDRAALPELESGRREERQAVAPRNETEARLAAIWEEVLGAPGVGVLDNFFDLGGHSLLGTQVISRVFEVFRVDLPIQALFTQPTVAQLAVQVDEAASAGPAGPPPLERVPRDRRLPLSFAQQRLWFLDQLEPGSPAYNVPGALRIRGAPRPEVLEHALNQVVRRHESLRTRFAIVDGEPAQEVDPARPLVLPLVDLGALDAGQRARESERLIRAEARRPFDLRRGPMIRAAMLRHSPDDHVLLATMHHIVSDGWSMGILKREMSALYRASIEGAEPALADLPVQYPDFAVWQRAWLKGEVLEEKLEYWRRHLAGAPTVTELPTDRPRPATPTQRGSSLECFLPRDLSRSLAALGRRHEATSFMVLLAGFEALLARLCGQYDLCLGSPVAGRTRVEIEELIGFFVNTLVLRSDLGGDPTFDELVVRLREVVLEGQAHQDLPFEKLVEELEPARSLSHSPLFQVWFTLQNVPQEELELPGLAVSSVETHSATAKFDLILSIVEQEDGLAGTLEYSTDLFEEQTARRVLEHYRTLLEGIAADPARRLSELPLLTESERRELLVARNETVRPYPRDRGVHRLFAEAARRRPAAPALALAGEPRELTYGELDRRANQLARRLASLGAGRGSRVGLYLEHSFEAVVAMLGTLRAGAAYVPVDPRHPRRQVEFVFEDSGVSVVLTQSALAQGLLAGGAEVLCLDGDPWPLAGEDDGDPGVDVGPGEPAYVMYTSGSTGRPKGVEIEHGALACYVWWARETYTRGEGETFAFYSSLAFDLTVTSVYPPLLAGGRIRVYGDSAAEPAVLAVMRENRVDVLKLTPSHLALIKDRDNRDSRIRRLIVGGEVLTTDLARQVLASFGGGVEILNEYGPTEATVGCMLHRFDAERDRRHTVPIGLPAANRRIYVLDSGREAVADNVVGELFIAGEGLARGYLNHDDLTAASFVENPFVPGERMYRTGDLARWLPEGSLEFVGRRDDQVKFHGYRVELEGLRSSLVEHPKVRDAVVVLARDGRGIDVLVAYYAARHPLPPAELRAFLARQVIEETIPNLFLHLRRLPLTLQGKVNRAALPSIEQARARLQRRYGEPRSAIEELIAGIWAQVLGLERVGNEENFFELGGHSLLATQVTSRVRETFGVELPLRSLFEGSTVAELSRIVERAMHSGEDLDLPPIEPVPRRGGVPVEDLPLSYAQRRIWFVHKLDPGGTAFNVPSYSCLAGPLEVAALEASFAELVRRHETLRMSFIEVEGRPRQRISPPDAGWRLPLVDLRGLDEPRREREAGRVAGWEIRRPFDLEGRLLRVCVFALTADRHHLLVNMHHIVTDGWSMGVLLRELLALYEAAAARRPSPLPEPELDYGDFAAWQRRSFRGEALESHLAYWRSHLAPPLPKVELPADRPRPEVGTLRGARSAVELSKAVSEGVKALSRRAGTTPFMTLMAAFNAWLYVYLDQEELVVGTDVANRNRIETEGLVGFFVNQLVVRADLSGDPTWLEVLHRVRGWVVKALAHQDLPFDQLVEALRPERKLRQPPLFQVKLILQNAPAGELQIPGLELCPLEVDTGATQLDFILMLWETPDGLRGHCLYNTDLFDAATVRRMTGDFEAVLGRLVAHPETRLGELARWFAGERRQERSRAASELAWAARAKLDRLHSGARDAG